MLQASTVYIQWLSNFADVASITDTDSRGLGFTSSGTRSDINLRFELGTPDGLEGGVVIKFNGVELQNVAASDLGGAGMNSFEIVVSLARIEDNPSGANLAGDKLLAVIHESGIHAETMAGLLEQYRDGGINAAGLIAKYQEAIAGEGERDHLTITPGSNALYESMVTDAKSVLQNVTTRTNRMTITAMQDDPKSAANPKNRNTKLLETYGQYAPNKNNAAAWNSGYVSLYELFSKAYDDHKEVRFNPDLRGNPLNALPNPTTVPEE